MIEKSTIPFYIICLFAVIRTAITLSFFSTHGMFGYKFLELFGLLSSYGLIILFLICLSSFKFDKLFILISFFCIYTLLSLSWGSNLQETIRFLLPFVIFFAVRSALTSKDQVKLLAFLIILSFIIPIIGSSLLILMKKSLYLTVYQTGIDRYSGMYLKIHTLAHCMLIFFFIAAIYQRLGFRLPIKEKYINILFFFLSILALFNLYKSVTRTVWIGLIVFSSFYLIGKRKYLILLLCGSGLFFIVLLSSQLQSMLFDIIQPLQGQGQISNIGSGRLGGWTGMVMSFLNEPLEMQFLGLGIGSEVKSFFGGSHNDLMSLLISLGYLGLSMYLLIYVFVVFDIIKSKIDRVMKFIFLGIVFSVITMNFGSNSYLSRFELGQYFYLIIALFYILDNLCRKKQLAD